MRNQIICITGASGSGKTTLVEHLFQNYPDMFQDIPSILTRPPRTDNESLNIHISKDEFEDRFHKNELLWKIENHGFLYGTQKSDVRSVLAQNARAILIMSPRCVPLLMRFSEEERIDPARFLFLHICSPAQKTITARLTARGDSNEAIQNRITECVEWDTYMKVLPYPIHFLENTETPEVFLKKAIEIIFAN